LFSDTFFADQFLSVADVANRQMLDSGKAANDDFFWEQVQKLFVNRLAVSLDSDCFNFADDKCFVTAVI
jgi:hypothetical protein